MIGVPTRSAGDPWRDLQVELDCWSALGRPATLWWRDDDAAVPTPELRRVLALQGEHDLPLALAVIPYTASDQLVRVLADHTDPTSPPLLLQHGYAHQNHAPPDEKHSELGGHRPTPHILAELALGHQRLSAFPGALPILVPPWNRIAPHLLPLLPEIGILGISAFGPRSADRRQPGLSRTNAHVDIIDWRGGRGFIGTATALDRLISHLRRRRAGPPDGDIDVAEPTGLLTHHLDHDSEHWRFLDALFRHTVSHPAVHWLSATELFMSDHE